MAPLNHAPRIKAKHSLKFEFSLWVGLFLSLTILTLTWFTLRQEREALTAEVTRRGLALTQYVAAHGLDPFLTSDKLTLATLVADVMKNPDIVYALMVDSNGRVVASDRSELIGRPYRRPAGHYPLDRPAARVMTWVHPLAGKVMDIGMPLILQGKAKIGEVHLGVSYASINQVVSRAWTKNTWLALIFLAVGVTGSILVVTLMLRPVSALTKGAQAIGSGDLNYHIPVKRRNELGQLAETFNLMTQELQVATAKAIEQETMQKELQLAHQIQHMLLPKETPVARGYSFSARYRAAKEVGGDYYDFLWLGKDRLALTVADVCGKGVPAAMLMSVARSMLKSIAGNFNSPADTVRELNRLIHGDLKVGFFITLFYAVLDIPKKILTYTSAGHNPGLMWQHQKKNCLDLLPDPPCLPLGVDKSENFDKLVSEKKISLSAGDVVVLYTDGVTEAMNSQWEEFGEQRLRDTLRRQAGAENAETILMRLEQDVNQFCGEFPQSDDIAVVAFKVG